MVNNKNNIVAIQIIIKVDSLKHVLIPLDLRGACK